jgi:LPS-assembly protein
VNGYRLLLCFVAGICLLAASNRVAADDLISEPWQISANRIIRFEKSDIIVAEGSVVLHHVEEVGADPMVIRADWIRYNVKAGSIKARGNLDVHSRNDVLTAQSARFDLNRQTGFLTMTSMRFSESKWHFSGQEVEKTGELTYHFKDGRVTTCPESAEVKPLWSVNASDVYLNTGDKARLKNVSLRVKDVTIAYLPYLVIPVSRQSGFLTPEWSQSQLDGTGFNLPFFWNLSPSFDATFYPGILTKRGVTAGAEFRYRAAERSQGTIAVNYQHDKTTDTVEDEYKSDGYLRTDHDRYWLRAKADHDFGNGLKTKLDLDMVSDLDYLQEFRNGIIGFDTSNDKFLATHNRGFQEESIPFRESTLQLGKTTASMFLGGEIRIVDDERNELSATSTLHALPRIIYNGRVGIPKTPVPCSLNWDSEYIFYWRDEGIGEHRLDIHPGLVVSIPSDFIEGTISTGIRETMYRVEVFGDQSVHDWSNNDTQFRRVWDFEMDFATTFARDFSINLGSVKRFNHKFRPSLAYSYITSTDQGDLPYLDAHDRIESQHHLSYGIDNYFRIGGLLGDNSYDRRFGYFKISQAYNIHEARRSLEDSRDDRHPFSDILFELEFYPFEKLRIAHETALSVYGKGVTFYNFKTSYYSRKTRSLSINYRYNKVPSVGEPYFYTDSSAESSHQLDMEIQAALSKLFSVKGNMTHSLSSNHMVEASVHLIYHPACWSMELLASKTSDDHRIGIIFSLVGLGKVMEFDF